ncbi:MAG: hypothetical protein CK425_08960 [Parachlamydia sp.]|nr:MAG: hypothetical protein CK425_08960 [Parachlamydia sp.]
MEKLGKLKFSLLVKNRIPIFWFPFRFLCVDNLSPQDWRIKPHLQNQNKIMSLQKRSIIQSFFANFF